MTSWKDVALLSLLGTLMLTGVAAFVVGADHDYHYSLDDRLDERPERYPTPYDTLSPDQQATVDAAIDGESFVFQSAEPVPPTLVERDGVYYRFDAGRSLDWSEPSTALPAGLTVFAVGGGVALIRRDVRRNAF